MPQTDELGSIQSAFRRGSTEINRTDSEGDRDPDSECDRDFPVPPEDIPLHRGKPLLRAEIKLYREIFGAFSPLFIWDQTNG